MLMGLRGAAAGQVQKEGWRGMEGYNVWSREGGRAVPC